MDGETEILEPNSGNEPPAPTPGGGNEPPAPTQGGGNESSASEKNKGNEPPAKTFTQEDIDKAIEAAKENWKKEQSEAERLSKLNKDDRAKEEFRLQREKLDNERAEFERERLISKTGDLLVERGLSRDFAERLCGKDAEETKANIDAFEKAFKTAVEQSVTERLKGKTPKGGGEHKETDPFLSGFGN